MSLSQCNNLLAYMKAGNSITAAKALKQLGITSLHRRLSDLKERGYEINDVWTVVKTRYRNGKTKVKTYSLSNKKGGKK